MQLAFDEGDLRPLVEMIVAATLERLEAQRQKLSGKLAYPAPEAAALLGVRPHVLRDARLRGEITGSRVGKRILYAHDELLAFLRRQRHV
ncbi:MAG: helix-turn-helix domain-containing protein [Planctomycetes bacterium]|nr:helix-turn-helix domain-containing protein [Planctomycetota bacterium]